MSISDTNLSERPMPQASQASGTLARERAMKTLRILIQREFWEHRALWMAPLATAVLLVACAFPAHIDFPEFSRSSSAEQLHQLAWFAALQWGLTLLQFLIAGIVLNFYLLDCLYAERKDRSILFWKSMPASDGATVISKLLVAQVVVPLGVFALSIVTDLLFSAIWMAGAAMGHFPAAVAVWNTMAWLKVEVTILFTLIVACAWYAPISAFLLLVSAWARRSVFLWATLPPILALVLERIAFGTHHVWNLMAYRTDGIFYYVHLHDIVQQTVFSAGSAHPISLGQITVQLAGAFANIDMWIGLMVTGALTYAAVRIRRYRDDT